ncbi:hypothetical protein KC319_g63 [Hortaea werneckii]|nr:hypothetical protein KC319_g63 [Hortaea werneckii]
MKISFSARRELSRKLMSQPCSSLECSTLTLSHHQKHARLDQPDFSPTLPLSHPRHRRYFGSLSEVVDIGSGFCIRAKYR